MDNIESHMKGPRNAIAFYVKVYSKYIKKINPNIKHKQMLTDAVRSWVTLNDTDKMEFKNKFNECKKAFRKKVADQLKNAVPFLQKKNAIITNNVAGDATRDIVESDTSSDLIPVYNSPIEDIQEQEFIKEISEPSPPKLKCAADLYKMLNQNSETKYSELEEIEKRRYRGAVLTLKRHYINQYKLYLESLSDEKLKAHYRKVKNDQI